MPDTEQNDQQDVPSEQALELVSPPVQEAESVSEAHPLPRRSRYERRADAAADALRTLIRDIYMERFSQDALQQHTVKVDLQLSVTPGENWQVEFDPPLRDQLLLQTEEVQSEWGFFKSGSVHCFRCESSDCPHSRPSEISQVFMGYDSMGAPVWHDFAQTLIDKKDERVHRLYDKQSNILTLLQFGKELKENQLSSYGRSSKTYALLGQISLGYLHVPKDDQKSGEADGRLALTIQLVESRNTQGRFELQLNTVSAIEPDRLEHILVSDRHVWIHRAREQALRKLATIQGDAEQARARRDTAAFNRSMRRVGGVLRNFSSSLERGDRQRNRRTGHAELRRSKDGRPVAQALDDVKKADIHAFYFDERKQTNIVWTRPGRAHVFNDDGKHVTSFSILREGVDQRLRSKRWCHLLPDQIEPLKNRIAQFSSDTDKDAGTS